MGIEMSLAYTINAAMPKGTASAISEMLRQASNDIGVDQMLTYASHVDAYNRGEFVAAETHTVEVVVWVCDGCFGAVVWVLRYRAKNPPIFAAEHMTPTPLSDPFTTRVATDEYIREFYLNMHQPDSRLKKQFLAMQCGEVLKIDATFAEARHIRVDGKQ
eukprot:1173296-Prorocentrum_minimum.AAC.2